MLNEVHGLAEPLHAPCQMQSELCKICLCTVQASCRRLSFSPAVDWEYLCQSACITLKDQWNIETSLGLRRAVERSSHLDNTVASHIRWILVSRDANM
jgi:hypothetical protein